MSRISTTSKNYVIYAITCNEIDIPAILNLLGQDWYSRTANVNDIIGTQDKVSHCNPDQCVY